MSIYDKYQAVIGLEVHAQLATKSKAYSYDATEYGASPNTQVSPVTLGHPGTLPRMNQKAVEYAVKMGIATKSKIREYNQFARKNYFYADLPKGYQISQFDTPLCDGGIITIQTEDGPKDIRLERIHMEEDSGKSNHDIDPYNSLIDLNRAGVPLIEIVTHPDLRSGDEAYQYLMEVRKLVRYLEICDGNMEEGSLRCDANISVMLKGADKFGQKVEVKNMNSMRNVMRAINYEIKRQIEAVEAGEYIEQQTRTYDALQDKTFVMRSKEEAHDYRYFPEADLPPVVVTEAYVDEVKAMMPPLPNELKAKYMGQGLKEYDASVLTDEKGIALYYEELIAGLEADDYKSAANWIIGPVKSYLNEKAVEIEAFPLSTGKLLALINMIKEGKTNFSVAAQRIFPVMLERPEDEPLSIAQELNLIQESDVGLIQELIDDAIGKYPDKVEAYKAGNKNLIGLFMGEVMKASRGKADPKLTNQLLREKLEA